MSGPNTTWRGYYETLKREILAIDKRLRDLATIVADLMTSGGAGITSLTGDVTASGPGSAAATIANDAVTNAKAANMAQATIKGRADGAGTGDPQDLTANQVSTILDTATDPFVRTSAIGGGVTRIGSIQVSIGDGLNVITTGIKCDLRIPASCTITKATLLADQPGSIVIDVWNDAYGNYPPTDADSITASAPPTISSATKSQDTTLTGWTTSISAGNTLRFNVDSCTSITRVQLELEVTI